MGRLELGRRLLLAGRGQEIDQHRGLRVEQGHVDAPAATDGATMAHRRQESCNRAQTGEQVCNGDADLCSLLPGRSSRSPVKFIRPRSPSSTLSSPAWSR